jgi:hypothetical protein
MNRAFDGATDQKFRDAIEKYGLDRPVEEREGVRNFVKEFVDEVGFDGALDALNTGYIAEGAMQAYVFAELIDIIEDELNSGNLTPEEFQQAQAEQIKLINRLDLLATERGRFIGALADIYNKSKFNYSAEKVVQRYKDANFGEIDPKTEQEIRDAANKIKNLESQISDLETRIAQEAEARRLAEITNIELQQKIDDQKPKSKAESKKAADEFRKLKKKPITFYDASGRPINIPGGAAPGVGQPALSRSFWDDAIELGAQAIAASGKISDGVAAAVTRIENEPWFQALPQADQDAVRTQVEQYLNNEYGGSIKIPQGLIRSLVEMGAKDIDEVIDGVMNQLSPKYPGKTRRDFRDAITNYHRDVTMNQDDVKDEINAMKRAGRLMSQLEDLRMGIFNQKDPRKKAKMTDQEKQLRSQIKSLLQGSVDFEAKRLDRAKESVRKRIEELEERLATGNYQKAKPTPVTPDAELEDLRARRDELKEMIDKEEDLSEVKRLERAKESVRRRIDELKERLATGNYQKEKPSPVTPDAELAALRAERDELKEKIDEKIEEAEMKNMGRRQKILSFLGDVFNLSRNMLATGEFSFVLVQGKFLLGNLVGHPLTAAKSFKEMFKSMFSDKNTKEFMRKIKSMPEYEEMQRAGLRLADYDSKILSGEETVIRSGIVNWVWDAPFALLTKPFGEKGKNALQVISSVNPLKIFDRAAVTFLNTARVERYLDLSNQLKKAGMSFNDSPQEFKNAADVVNTMSGRSGLGKAEIAAPLLNYATFSARNWVSILKTSTPIGLYWYSRLNSESMAKGFYKPSVAQKALLKDFMITFATTAAVVTGFAMRFNDDDDEETEVVLDPTSVDFGKIKIGDTRIDLWGGRIQTIILQARLLYLSNPKFFKEYMEQKGVKDWSPMDGNERTMADVFGRYLSGRLHPTLGFALEFSQTKQEEDGKRYDAFGNEFIWSDEFIERVTPIIWGTYSELSEVDPQANNKFLMALAALGVGVQSYVPKSKKTSVSFTDPKNKELIAKYKAKGFDNIKNDTYPVSLTPEELAELNKQAHSKGQEILSEFSKFDIDDSMVKPFSYKELSASEIDNSRKALIKSGVAEDQITDEMITQKANEMYSKKYIADLISEFYNLGKKAAAEQYFIDNGKRVPETIIGSIKDYEIELKNLKNMERSRLQSLGLDASVKPVKEGEQGAENLENNSQ